GMGTDSGFRPSVPRPSVIPVCYGGTSCRAGDWEADGAVGGRLSGRPPRVIAGAGDRSAHGGRHDRREYGGAATAATGSAVVRARSRPVSAGAAAIHARPPRARAAARVLRAAARAR